MPHRGETTKRPSPRLGPSTYCIKRVKVEDLPDHRHKQREHKIASGRDDLLRDRERAREAPPPPAADGSCLRKKIKQEPRDWSERDDSAGDRKREPSRNGRERVHDRDEPRKDDQRRVEQRRDDPRRDDPRRDEQRRDEQRRDEQRRDDPRRDDPRRDDPRRDEQRRDDPRRDDLRRDEQRRDDPRRDDLRRDEQRRDDPRRDDPRRDEQRRDDPRRDEQRRDEQRRDEQRRDDLRRDDQKRDDPRRDEQKRDDPRRDDQKRDDLRSHEQRRQRSDEQRVDRPGASHRHDRERQRAQESGGGDAAAAAAVTQRERETNDRRRLAARQLRQQQSPTGNPFESQSPTESQRFGQPADANGEEAPGGGGVEKERPNFGLSGALTEDANTFRGVVIKYNEPPESRMPRKRWRLYPFKNDEPLPIMHVHRQSAYLLGRQRRIADIPIDHPSCSKQHAVLQYRLVEFARQDGTTGRRVKPYIIDLGSANGTYLNNQRVDAQRYYELRERDVLRFGFSSREYVILHEGSDTTVVGADGGDDGGDDGDEEEEEMAEEEASEEAEEALAAAAKAKKDAAKAKRAAAAAAKRR